LALEKDIRFVTAENNFFMSSVPPRHYVGIYLVAFAVNESELRNMEPEKCDGWEWASASQILEDDGRYRPLFVPLRNVFATVGLIQE
jgi:8-oxo-dGTP diphosphatase